MDENDNELDGDEDFSEGACFEDILSQYLGISVGREDREVFYIEDATKSQIDQLIYLMENYWILRDEFVRTYSEALYQEVLTVRKRLNGPEGD